MQQRPTQGQEQQQRRMQSSSSPLQTERKLTSGPTAATGRSPAGPYAGDFQSSILSETTVLIDEPSARSLIPVDFSVSLRCGERCHHSATMPRAVAPCPSRLPADETRTHFRTNGGDGELQCHRGGRIVRQTFKASMMTWHNVQQYCGEVSLPLVAEPLTVLHSNVCAGSE